MSRARCRRGLAVQAGMVTTELAVAIPAVLLLVLLAVQYGLWYHAAQVADAAATRAARAVAAAGAEEAAGQRTARDSLAKGAGNLSGVTVTVSRTTDAVTVEVTGRAPALVPVGSWGVAARAAAPIEQFVGADAR